MIISIRLTIAFMFSYVCYLNMRANCADCISASIQLHTSHHITSCWINGFVSYTPAVFWCFCAMAYIVRLNWFSSSYVTMCLFVCVCREYNVGEPKWKKQKRGKKWRDKWKKRIWYSAYINLMMKHLLKDLFPVFFIQSFYITNVCYS